MKEIISTENAPGAIGPYSQAVKVGNLVFCSGQIPIDPKTGEFVSEDVAEQTEQVIKNLSAVLEAAGTNLNNVVKTTVFLADMNDFAAMNEVYAKHFTRKTGESNRSGGTSAARCASRDRSYCNRLKLKARPQN